ncbi:MAG: PHP domain-containing protein [Clostridiales bacterium]|nr:PHP domain-containing protein [Clostridiales bacterium]
MIKADLHMHSTASDGVYAPDELMKRAVGLGFTHVALTDHDSVAGIPLARETAEKLGMTLTNGVELSCGAQKEIHVLGYGFDPDNEALRAFCEERVAQREARTAAMVQRLCELGKPIDMARVRELARGVMGRPHVARAMLEAGYVLSVSEAFDRYLKPGRPAYVPKEDVKVSEAVRLIDQAGGIAVLAHPMELKMGDTMLESLIGEWKGQGLAGVEVYHPSAQNNHASFLLHLAQRENMLVTGGSDFHGEAVRRTEIGEGLDRWRTMESDMHALLERIRITQQAR